MVLDMMKISVRDKIVHCVENNKGWLGENACSGKRQAARDDELRERNDGDPGGPDAPDPVEPERNDGDPEGEPEDDRRPVLPPRIAARTPTSS